MRIALCLVVGVLALLSDVARASDARRLQYVVDSRSFRRHVAADTRLTVELYRDPACSQPWTATPLLVRASDLDLVEELNAALLKSSARRERRGRIVHLLRDPALVDVPDAPVFLRMLGAGGQAIAPLGRQCQAQFGATTLIALLPSCMRVEGDTLIVDRCNLRVQNGSASAVTASVNGLGNVVVGYDKECSVSGCTERDRSGSHNLVIGDGHSYASYGGLVAGADNAILAPSATVLGGEGNVAASTVSVVGGGRGNRAGPNADASSVVGGAGNQTERAYATIAAGRTNRARGFFATVLGGNEGRATRDHAVASGGRRCYAAGAQSVASGGDGNIASGAHSVTAGGERNHAQGAGSTVAAGRDARARGETATVLGGAAQSANASGEVICGVP